MPAIYQGTVLRGEGPPILDLSNPSGRSDGLQRRLLDRVKMWNTRHALLRSGNSELESRIESYELAYRMQADRARGGRPREGVAQDARALRDRQARDPRVRREVPACAAARRARRALRPGLRRRQPQRRQLGRPRRSQEEPRLPRGPHRSADRGASQGSQAARAARRDARGVGRRVRSPADRRVRRGHRPRPQLLRLHDVDGRRRREGRGHASARPTSSARPASATATTSRTCTRRS